jgi:hypothetical protein
LNKKTTPINAITFILEVQIKYGGCVLRVIAISEALIEERLKVLAVLIAQEGRPLT